MKKTIGFMTRALGTPVGFAIWQGVKNAAEKHNVNLVTISGDNVGRDKTLIYELMKEKNVDGVLTWASNRNDEYIRFYQERLGPLPIVTLTLPIDPYPVIQIDSYTSMKLAVKHLIEVHGRKKIAFIPGDKNNNYFKERFQGYKDALQENGIPLDEKLISSPFSTIISFDEPLIIREKMKEFEEKNILPGKGMDAILTVTEATSLSLFDYFKEKGIRIPEDIAVISYDNSTRGRFTKPTPTAMILPFDKQSEKGMDVLMDILAGKKVLQVNKIPGSLQINQSCGCKEKSIDLASSSSSYQITHNERGFKAKQHPSKKIIKLDTVKNKFVKMFLELVDSNTAHNKEHMKQIELFCLAIGDSLERELLEGEEDATIDSLDPIISYFAQNNISLQQLQNIVSLLRNTFIPEIDKEETVNRAENIFHKMRTSITVSITYFDGRKLSDRDKAAEDLNHFIRLISSQFTYDDIWKSLEKRIPQLLIQELYIVLYPNRIKYQFPEPLPEKSELTFAIRNGTRVLLGEDDKFFRTEDILPHIILSQITSREKIVLPLYANGHNLGYVVFVDAPNDRHLYPGVRDAISNSLQGAFLMGEMEKAEKESADNLVKLKQKAEVITGNTESINTLIQSITGAMENISHNVKLISGDIFSVAEESNTVVKVTDEANTFVDKLNRKAEDITGLTKLINDLSERTDVLSINARIEAARAGASGKGFTIVANEIKELSQKISESIEKINKMIEEIQIDSKDTLNSMSNIHGIINKIYSLTENINVRIEKHLTATEDISGQLTEASQGSHEIYSAILEVAEEATK
jgi:DNA-binding LacI/PurR family transcriptional regulator